MTIECQAALTAVGWISQQLRKNTPIPRQTLQKYTNNMKQLSQEQIENLPEWIPIAGFEGLYEVNPREAIIKSLYTGRILKPSFSGGYPYVGLHKDGKECNKSVHRIVATAAFGYYNIPMDGLDVCHLDEERHDARIQNLAIGTRKENLNFEKARERQSEAQKGEKSHMYGKHLSKETIKKLSKPVAAYKNGEVIMIFESSQEAGRNGFNCGHVNSCCNGKLKTHKGYQWRYLKS